ncbi:MAG: hypothetical protein ABWY06_05275 [Pseudomonas sp.]|uniref:hypothetical protein n=1 Tax=Pseudomonas sp. TaxID=306 RepID=UPI00339B51C4
MKRIFSVGLSLSMLIALPALAAEVKVKNESSWNINEVYFAPSSETEWGPDHLGEEVLMSGMTLTLTGVTAGKWDVRLVDEEQDVCVVKEVKIKASETWTITDDDLLGCQAATPEEE